MEIGSMLLVLAVLLLVGMYLYAPLNARAHRIPPSESQEVSALKAERDRVIDSLQELDFDHQLGKIPAEDYPAQRAALLQKGADTLRKLDELASLTLNQEGGQGRGSNAEARVEKAVAAGRADSSAKGAQLADEEIESMIAARRKEHNGKSAGFCPKCGKPVLVLDKFCPSCGKSLT